MDWVLGIVLAGVAGVLSPILGDTLACVYIWFMNRAKGRPTWVRGTEFRTFTWPCGFTIHTGRISKVSFSHVYLRGRLSPEDTRDGLYSVKKSAMKKMIMGEY